MTGRWGLIPWFAKSPALKYSTNNARSEELARKATYREPWLKSQRCIIPARSFDEPCWETGRSVWWRFRRIDGALWGLAGLWNTWTDPATGELHESYTMLTMNADKHALMRRMHKPKPNSSAGGEDKRSVIPLAPEDWGPWLSGSPLAAQALFALPGADQFSTERLL